MGNSLIELNTRDCNETIKKLYKLQEAPEKVCKAVVSDFKARAPSWIAAEVTKVYTINKKEISPSKTGNGSKAGNISVRGRKISDVAIIYSGRLLTPTHFKMSPKQSSNGGYTLKVEVIKGYKKTWDKVKKLTKKQLKNVGKNFTRQGTQNSSKSPKMLMHTGNRTSDGTNYIPFQRVSLRRNDIQALKTVSVPQMVSNEKVSQGIDASITTNMTKRLDQQMKRYGYE